MEMFVKVVAIGWWNGPGPVKKVGDVNEATAGAGAGALGSAAAGPLSAPPRGKATHHKHPELALELDHHLLVPTFACVAHPRLSSLRFFFPRCVLRPAANCRIGSYLLCARA